MNRNHNIHNGKSLLLPPSLFKGRTIEYLYHSSAPSNPEVTIPIHIHWFPPPAGHFKRNTEDSFIPQKNTSGIGGVIRDEWDSWMAGFYKKTSCHTQVMDEIEALLEGFKLVEVHNLLPVEFETESTELLEY